MNRASPSSIRRPAPLPAFWQLLWLGLAALLLAVPARAGALPGELPALAGRLSALAGDVRWFDRDSGAWVQTSESQPLRNWPLAPGDRLRTGAGGRAELRIGSTTVRLGADAELWLPRLDEQVVLLQLQAGSMAVRLADVDRDSFGPVELLTREGRWWPQQPGHYRLDRDRDATQASVWRGELRFEATDSALAIPAGRRADLWQDAGGTTRYAWAAIERDLFADWVARDERQDDAPISARYVPPGMTGWQDLDRHGDWVNDVQHGMVWQPRLVAPGWIPFHDGRWAWVAPWGWTWIDAAPWGFAPFHYGVWLTVGGRWSWSPGPRQHPPRFAPAHSAWVSGPQVGINIRIGSRPPPPRVVVPVVIQRPAPQPIIVQPPHRHEPRPIIVQPREPERRDPRGDRDGRYGRDGRDGRDGDRRDAGRWDDRRPDDRRAEPRGDERRGDDRPGDDRRPDAPRFDPPRRDGPRSDAGSADGPRPAGPERPLRQAPQADAPVQTAVPAPALLPPPARPVQASPPVIAQPAPPVMAQPAPPVMAQPAPPVMAQPVPPRRVDAPAAEPPRRGPAPGGGPRERDEPREARSPRAEPAERTGRAEPRERRVDDRGRDRDNPAMVR